MHIAILGSCVTRDGFELDKGLLRPGYYFARTSLASTFAVRPNFNVELDLIKSKFQRAMVERDLKKTFRTFLSRSSLDLLIYDAIDERFNLLVNFTTGEICTLSTEFRSVKYKAPGQFVVVQSGSDAYFDLWEKGWVELISSLKRTKSLHILRINRVKWADRISGSVQNTLDKQHEYLPDQRSLVERLAQLYRGRPTLKYPVEHQFFLPEFSNAEIHDANCFLERVYSRMEEDIPRNQFFNFSDEVFISDVQHIWGKSPFHYVPAYYTELMRQVMSAVDQRSQPETQSSAEERSFTLDAELQNGIVKASIQIIDASTLHCEFAFYLLADGKKIKVRPYSSENVAEFRIDKAFTKLEVMGFLITGDHKLIKQVVVRSGNCNDPVKNCSSDRKTLNQMSVQERRD